MNKKAYTNVIRQEGFSLDMYIDPFNKRVRVDDYLGNTNAVIMKAEEMAMENQAEKLIMKGRLEDYYVLVEQGFQMEAVINRYFLGSDLYFFCKYYSNERRTSDHWLKEDGILKNVLEQEDRKNNEKLLPSAYKLKKITTDDAEELAILYKNVFQIYPTPLHDPEYIKKTIDEGTIYVGFECNGKIVSAASAEVNQFYKNAELTDCATLPEHRKYGLMKLLLEKLEEELGANGIFCAYSIARALSFGMNAVLHQLGYSYRGRLTNNCFIFDKIEDMNVWVKDLLRC